MRGKTAPLMAPYHGPHPVQAPRFAEPVPTAARRQAPTVLVPEKQSGPMWPFVALGVAIVLAIVAVALLVIRA